MLPQTGERQIAESIEGIKPNHRQRYQFAINKIKERFCALERPVSILDTACGVGYGTMMIAEQVSSATGVDLNRSIIGVDIFQGAIDTANKFYKKENNEFMLCDISDEEDWPFKDTNFDAIVSIETIEHVEDQESLIKRYSDSTAFLIASVPNQMIVPFDRKAHPFHFKHFTKNEFQQLLNDYGFFIDVWASQYNKVPGIVYEDADDGMGFIVSASKK